MTNITEWKVVLCSTTNLFERDDCEVVDIGHSDKILLVECPAVAQQLSRLYKLLERVKASPLAMYDKELAEDVALELDNYVV